MIFLRHLEVAGSEWKNMNRAEIWARASSEHATTSMVAYVWQGDGRIAEEEFKTQQSGGITTEADLYPNHSADGS